MKKKRYLKIQDCFEFICPERWENLKFTDQSGVKSCTQCDRKVYKATNKSELLKLGREGKCAAYFAYEEVLLGRLNPPVFKIRPTALKSKLK